MSTRTPTPTAESVEHRPPRRHHIVALALSAGLSAIALTDAVTKIVTGHFSVFSDDSTNEPVQLFGTVVHGLAYFALLHCLWREREIFARVSRLLRVLRRMLMAAFAMFGAMALVASPVHFLVTGRTALPEDGVVGVVGGIVATLAFVLMLLGGTIVGLTQRRPTLGTGGRILIAMAPVLLVTLLLGFVAPDWAHPGYLEAVLNLGVSLVGVGATALPRPRAAA